MNLMLIGYGFGLGMIVSLAFWLPSRSRWRQRLEDLRDIHRIEGGYQLGTAVGRVSLDDAMGAFAQARTAYLPTYPGRGLEPEPAWVAWIREGGRDPLQPRPANGPRHLSMDPEPARPDLSSFPVWGEDALAQAPPARPTWDLDLNRRDWALVLVALLTIWVERRGYPWWQRVLDRAWEAGVVFEVSGARFNRQVWAGLDATAQGFADVWAQFVGECRELVADLRADLTRAAGWFRRRPQPGYRPKRYYPIKEG